MFSWIASSLNGMFVQVACADASLLSPSASEEEEEAIFREVVRAVEMDPQTLADGGGAVAVKRETAEIADTIDLRWFMHEVDFDPS